MKSHKKGLMLRVMNIYSRSKKTQAIFLAFTFFFSGTLLAAEKPAEAEKNWAKAQQDYYQELKKLKSPRDPSEVKALKEKILAPKKKALQEAYQTKPEKSGSTQSKTAGTQKPEPVETPKTVLDGKDIKKEISYSKKGAPEDMTKEESPEFSGPEVISEPNENGVGEIAYPSKKSKK